MQMPINYNVREWEETVREGKQSKRAGNVVHVFGFKNKFLREAGYHGITRKLPLQLPLYTLCPTKDLKTPIQTVENISCEML